MYKHFRLLRPAAMLGNAPTVKTSLGRVSGIVTHARGSTKPVYNYLGIPYALPPIGERRFLPPVPGPPWDGILDGAKTGLPSPQILALTKTMLHPFIIPHDESSEDCLYLNIYTPDVNTDTRRPVLFFIHGGGLFIGMGDINDGTAVTTYGDVVVVTFNHRLGALGFLNTEDDICPGNMGLWDQVAALKWVNQHISDFGGDPENVTLIGFSAGAMAVQMMMLSPVTKGLFHRAISQSGSALAPNITPSGGKEIAFKLGQILGCETNNTKTLVEYLRNISPEELIEAEMKLGSEDGVTFLPCVDNNFVMEKPEELYAAGDFHRVPYLTGFTEEEGLYFLMTWCSVTKEISNEEGLRTLEMFAKGWFPIGLDEVLNATKAKYFPDLEEDDSGDTLCPRARVSQAFGDMFQCAPAQQSAMLHSKAAPTYLYVFSHRPSYSTYPGNIPGATHGDDQAFVWGDPFMKKSMIQKTEPYTRDEECLSKDLIQYFSNFARTGDPNGTDLVEWPPFNTESQNYLNIDTPLTVRDHRHPDRMELWNVKLKQIMKCSK